MADADGDELLFTGRLLSVNASSDPPRLQIKKEAIAFLQRLAAPVAVVSLHGGQPGDKAALLERILGPKAERESVLLRRGSSASVSSVSSADRVSHYSGSATGSATGSVLMYVKAVDYSSVKYLVVLSRPDSSENSTLEQLLYSIMAALSSVVLHVVDGEMADAAFEQFAYVTRDESEGDAAPKMAFPQSPKLMWLLQNTSTSTLKERVQGKNMTAQDAEAAYMRDVLAAQQSGPNALLCSQLQSAFPDQTCFPLPDENTESFAKRMEKLVRVLLESERNRYAKGAVLNGPLFESILVSMLAHRDNVFQAFRGRVWKDTIHNCCLNIVESGIKLYKLRMAERLGKLVDISDLNGYKPLEASPREPLPPVELPCDLAELRRIHDSARREAKISLRNMPVRKGKLSTLLQKLFKDLIDSLFIKIQEENHKVSAEMCQNLLAALHKKMMDKVEQHLLLSPQDDEDGYSFQSSEFKRFFHHYQMRLYELMSDYTVQAKGPAAKEELANFSQTVIRLELADWTAKLDKIRQHDLDGIQEKIDEREQERENSNARQRQYQKDAVNAQTEVGQQLVEVAKLQALRKEALDSAVDNLARMHELAVKQKELLEEEAFVSIQLPSEKVIEAAQDTEPTELQGYLIKQGGGGNAFNPLGRKNWKQRYFILLGSSLIYARTKDDYERGKIIKELHINGCRIEPSRDAGEGFNIIPPASGKQAHVFELHQGIFEKNTKKRSSTADSGRTFKLRAQSIEERDVWINKLRKAAGGYR